MASIGHIKVEVKPTVTLESARACVMMLNLFLDGNARVREPWRRLQVGVDRRAEARLVEDHTGHERDEQVPAIRQGQAMEDEIGEQWQE